MGRAASFRFSLIDRNGVFLAPINFEKTWQSFSAAYALPVGAFSGIFWLSFNGAENADETGQTCPFFLGEVEPVGYCFTPIDSPVVENPVPSTSMTSSISDRKNALA